MSDAEEALAFIGREKDATNQVVLLFSGADTPPFLRSLDKRIPDGTIVSIDHLRVIRQPPLIA